MKRAGARAIGLRVFVTAAVAQYRGSAKHARTKGNSAQAKARVQQLTRGA